MPYKDKDQARESSRRSYKRNRERVLVKHKAYRATHREELSAYLKAYRKANLAKLVDKDKAYRVANKEKEATRSRIYRAANLEKVRARGRAYCAANKEKALAYRLRNLERQKHRSLKREYGIGLEQYNILLDEQAFSCSVCSRPDYDDRRALHVDHDHTSGLVRGLLCNACNTGIGKFKDDPTLLRRAAAYVEFFNYAKESHDCD